MFIERTERFSDFICFVDDIKLILSELNHSFLNRQATKSVQDKQRRLRDLPLWLFSVTTNRCSLAPAIDWKTVKFDWFAFETKLTTLEDYYATRFVWKLLLPQCVRANVEPSRRSETFREWENCSKTRGEVLIKRSRWKTKEIFLNPRHLIFESLIIPAIRTKSLEGLILELPSSLLHKSTEIALESSCNEKHLCKLQPKIRCFVKRFCFGRSVRKTSESEIGNRKGAPWSLFIFSMRVFAYLFSCTFVEWESLYNVRFMRNSSSPCVWFAFNNDFPLLSNLSLITNCKPNKKKECFVCGKNQGNAVGKVDWTWTFFCHCRKLFIFESLRYVYQFTVYAVRFLFRSRRRVSISSATRRR